MAGWPDGTETTVHFGVMDTGPDGKAEVASYLTDKLAAWQASTMEPAAGHSLEFVEYDVTLSPVRPARLDSEPPK
ncbi:MAG TPA: hypothetical protein VK599_17765 [Streptosporangiaceae bacterium]|nr:hypothetical protein [Streptosporangiaceae bacterium]